MGRRVVAEVAVRDHGRITPRPLDELLLELAAADAGSARLVSLHLDTRSADAREELRVAAAMPLPALPPAEAAALHRDLARAVETAVAVLDQRRDVGFEAVAAFFCEARELELAVLWHGATPTRLTLDRRADVFPLARWATEQEVALVAVVDGAGARLLEASVSHGRVGRLREEAVAGPAGASTRLIEASERLSAALVARFGGVAAQRGRPPRVVLAGDTSALISVLPDRVLRRAERVSALGELSQALARAARREVDEAVRLAREEAAIGRAAVGVEETLAALNAGRARLLLLGADLAAGAPGGRCARCAKLVPSAEQTACDACGGLIEPVDLASQAARLAILASTPLLVVEGEFPERLAARL